MRAELLEPEADEVILWRHSGNGLSQPKPIPEHFAKISTLAYYVIWGLLAIYWLTRPGAFEYIISVGFALQVVVMAALFYFGPKVVAALQRFFRNGRQPEITVIPFWMSEDRLAYNSGDMVIDETLNISEILSVASDYAMGSPTLCLHLKDRTINIISSELNSLKKHLYSLRPDLKQVS